MAERCHAPGESNEINVLGLKTFCESHYYLFDDASVDAFRGALIEHIHRGQITVGQAVTLCDHHHKNPAESLPVTKIFLPPPDDVHRS